MTRVEKILKNSPAIKFHDHDHATAGNMTDSEILRSPMQVQEVLYAVSEKHKHRNNELMTNTSSQTMDNSNR